jgi:WD40 repeat protein
VIATTNGIAVHLWNVRRRQLVQTITLPRQSGHAVGLDATGSRVAVGYWDDSRPQIYDVATGELLVELENRITGRAFHFSHDGSRILVASMGNDVSLFSASDGREIWTERGANFTLMNTAFSPDETLVATVGRDARLWLRQADTGELVYTIATGKGACSALAFHPEGQILAVGGIDGLVSLFQTSTGEKLFSLHGHEAEVMAVDFDPSGRFLVSVARDTTAKIWHLGAGGPQVRVGHTHYIVRVVFSPADDVLWAVGGEARDLQAIGVGDLSKKRESCPMDALRNLEVSPDGKYVALSGWVWVGRENYRVMLTDQHLNVLHDWEAPDQMYGSLDFSPDGRRLIAGSVSGRLRLYDIVTGDVLWSYGEGNLNAGVRNVALFSRDGRYIINGSREGTIRILNADSGELVRGFPIAETAVGPMVLDQAGERLFCGIGNAIEVWDWQSGRRLTTMTGHSAWLTALAMVPGDERLVSAAAEGTVRLWDVASGRQVMVVGRHDSQVTSVAVSHDGATIATGGEDNSLRLWETRQPSNTALDSRLDRLRASWAQFAETR